MELTAAATLTSGRISVGVTTSSRAVDVAVLASPQREVTAASAVWVVFVVVVLFDDPVGCFAVVIH
jgi:hypothetical protein